jgi:hypothetical protein
VFTLMLKVVVPISLGEFMGGKGAAPPIEVDARLVLAGAR